MTAQVKPAEILFFWFEQFGALQAHHAQYNRLWFVNSQQTDLRIRQQFEPAIQAALRGDLQDWDNAPDSCLALILLLDQFTRNSYRATPAAFAGDDRALSLTLHALDMDFPAKVEPVRRVFYYLPLEHAEDLALQNRCVELMADLIQEQADEHDMYQGFYNYAVWHREVIERYGRFPHRNAILQRESTPAELEYLKQPGSGF